MDHSHLFKSVLTVQHTATFNFFDYSLCMSHTFAIAENYNFFYLWHFNPHLMDVILLFYYTEYQPNSIMKLKRFAQALEHQSNNIYVSG